MLIEVFFFQKIVLLGFWKGPLWSHPARPTRGDFRDITPDHTFPSREHAFIGLQVFIGNRYVDRLLLEDLLRYFDIASKRARK